MPFLRVATGEKWLLWMQYQKVVEDTLIDVKFSGLSWEEMKGFIILVTKTKGSELSAKTDDTNYISINWEQLKKR
jgi:hypothetical protein